MKSIKANPTGLVLALLLAATTGTGFSQAGVNDSFSGINLNVTPVKAGVVSLIGPDISEISSLPDAQLTAFVRVLDATPTIPAKSLPHKGLVGAFWSLQNPKMPPLPGDTSGSAVWPLSDGNFLLNDVHFNYDAVSPVSATTGIYLPLNSPLTPNGGGGSGNSPIYPPGTLYVNSLTLSNGWLNFDTYNLIPGNTYLIARKTVLNNDFSACWVPEWTFNSTDTNQVFSIPCPNDSDMGFYRVVNYSLYQGPNPVITSPADNSTVSGIIQVNCALTDIFRADQATLFVDEINFGTVTNGVASWNLDTSLLANGPHSVDVQFLSEIPIVDDHGSNNIEIWTSDALLYNLNTSNFLAQNVAPRCFTAEFGTVPFAFDTAAPAIVNVSVFNASSNLVWNTSVTNNSAGTCYPYWYLLDNSGNPVPLPQGDESVTYNVEVTASPYNNSPFGPMTPGGGGASASFSLNISTDPHAGHTAVFRNEYGLLPLGINDNLDAVLNQTIGAVESAYNIHPNDMDGWDRGMNNFASPFIFAQNSDLPSFYNVLTNQGTGQFMYICDADADHFGAGTHTVITDVFYDFLVGTILGNSTKPSYPVFGHRVRLADIEGCNSAKGDLNLAFGSPDGLDHSSAMSKSSFVGWTSEVRYNGTYWPDTVYVSVIKYWQSYWIDGGFDDNIGISHANYQCLQDAGASVDEQLARKIRGSKNMTWIKKD